MNPTRQDAAQFFRDNWEKIIQLSIIRAQNILLDLDVEKVIEKMMKAEKEYGPFDLFSIDTFVESEGEVIDLSAYVGFGVMQLDDRYLDEAYV